MRFVHAADLHLDSPLRGLSRYEGAPVDRIRGATRRALENLVELCVEEQAAFLLLAGDLYDGDWRDYATGLFFAGQMSRLREAAIPVYLIRGNHDAASEISKHLPLPDNVRELRTRGPETIVNDELGVAVHGQGFATRTITEDLAAGYPDAVAGLFNVGLLHTCVDGRRGHDSYAPTSVETLVSKGYEYWALGHVHGREVLCEDPWIVFPGNLQGRHARETGDKGATLVTVEGGTVTGCDHWELDDVRWAHVVVDAEPLASADAVVDAVRRDLMAARVEAGERLLAARVSIAGVSAAHSALASDPERWENAVRAAANDLGDVWIEKVRLETRMRIDAAALAARDDAIGDLARTLDALERNDLKILGEVAPIFEDLARKLPLEVREGDEGVRVDDVEYLREAVREVRQLLLPRLLSEEGAVE